MDIWSQNSYLINLERFLFIRKYRIRNELGKELAKAVRNPFRLRDRVGLFVDGEEVLRFDQERIYDPFGNYVIRDMATGRVRGYVERRSIGSLIKNTSLLRDSGGRTVALMEEQPILWMAKRFLPFLTFGPKLYVVHAGKAIFAQFRTAPLRGIYRLDIRPGTPVDRRLILGAALLEISGSQ